MVRSVGYTQYTGIYKTMTRLFAGTPFDRPPRCETCGKLEEDCSCPPPPAPDPVRVAPEKQTAALSIEKRKRGKSVTVIRGLHENDLAEVTSVLKSRCGAGGSVQDGAIEIQGRLLDRVRTELGSLGYRVKG